MPKKVPTQDETKVCPKCGKPIRVSSSGSITAWIFRPANCACSNKKNSGQSLRDPPKPLKLTFIETQTEEEIEAEERAKRTPTPAEKSLLGKLINQKYHVTGFIGRGGMSVVYRARDLVMDKDVAIKVLNSNLAMDENSVKRFRVEAQAVNALNSKNIVKLYDFDMTEDLQPFLAVELLVGSSLADVLKTCPDGVPQDVSIGWFCQIASALEEAHYQGVVHRDIKPSNIAINQDEVKIFDFGIAKVFFGESGSQSKLTQTGEIFGSPTYMSPEQCRGERLNGRSDVYSLGVLMYEIISGQPPFVGTTMLDTMGKQISEHPKPLKEVVPEISDGLDYVIMRCLEKEPTMRYQTAKDLLIDLQCVQEHRKIPNMMRRNTTHPLAPITARGLKMPEGSLTENLRMASVVIAFCFLTGFGITAGLTWSPKIEPPKSAESTPRFMPDFERYSSLRSIAEEWIKEKKYPEAIEVLNALSRIPAAGNKQIVGQMLGFCYHHSGQNRLAYLAYRDNGVYPGDLKLWKITCRAMRSKAAVQNSHSVGKWTYTHRHSQTNPYDYDANTFSEMKESEIEEFKEGKPIEQ